jgi:hypothetical protein
MFPVIAPLPLVAGLLRGIRRHPSFNSNYRKTTIHMKKTSSFFCLKALAGSLLVGSLFLASASASETVILSERFVLNERLTSDLPNTSAWWGSQTTSLNQTVGGSIVGNGDQTVMTYFTNPGSLVSLAIGEILTVSFDFQLPNPPDPTNPGHSGIRFGLMNSTTSVSTTEPARASGDNFGNGYAGFAGYTGYGGWLNPHGANTGLRKRVTDGSQLLSGNAVWAYQPIQNTVDQVYINANETYTGAFQIERQADRVVASFSISGGNFDTITVTYQDTGGNGAPVYEFDTFAMFTTSARAGATYSLSSVDITVIPEPSAYAAAAGLLAAAVLLFRRRRGRAALKRKIYL